jgi:hypothetical protein
MHLATQTQTQTQTQNMHIGDLDSTQNIDANTAVQNHQIGALGVPITADDKSSGDAVVSSVDDDGVPTTAEDACKRLCRYLL